MTQDNRRLIFIMLTIVLIISSCRGGVTNSDTTVSTITPDSGESVTSTQPAAMVTSDPQEAVPLAPNPASIDIALEEGSATTATIGPEGGSITSVGVNGIEYNLTIPEGALFSPEEITMTPIASAEGKAIGDTFLAGVALQPEGLYFLELVTIEIAGGMVDESTVAFAAESGGQDFHLAPSKQTNGSITISTTHFSEFGASSEDIGGLLRSLVPIAELARFEHDLAFGDDQQALAAFERMIESLLAEGEIESFEQWGNWTAQIVSLHLRAIEVAGLRGWGGETPGLDLYRKLVNLFDQWFQQSDGLMQGFAEKCIQGEIEYVQKVKLFSRVGSSFIYDENPEFDEMLGNWFDVEFICLNLVVTWQANVVTKGGEFLSDILVGAERQSIYGRSNPIETELEVEYIEGSWLDTCVPTSGVAKLGFEILWDSLNLGMDSRDYISSILVFVSIIEPVYIDCSPAGFEFSADAQYPFHGGALEQINQHRVDELGRWEFELEYDPVGGVVAQFDENPENLTFPGGGYRFGQLISLYQNTPAN